MVRASSSVENISVLLNQGERNFAAPRLQSIAPFGESKLKDVNNDGFLDLIGLGAGISLALGQGDGTFSKKGRYATGSSPSSLAIEDLDLDSDLDILMLSPGSLGDEAEIAVRLNRTKGLKAAENVTTVTHADIKPTLISAPDTAMSGTSIPITWSVTNLGTKGTTTNWKDKFYLSDNPTFEGYQDQLIGEFEHTDSLAGDATIQRELDLQLPEDAIGNKYILIVSDGDNKSKELVGENNNLVVHPLEIKLSPYADLKVSNVKGPDLTIDDPAKVKVSWRVTNQGTGTGFSDTWTDRIIASVDAIADNNDDITLAEYVHTGALAKDEFYEGKESFLLPPAFTGRYNLFVQTDSGNTVFENGLEDNNSFNISFTPPPDLKVTDIVAPNAITAGQKINLSWTVQNQGDGEAVERWTDRIYLQEVGNADAKLIPLKSYSYDRGLGVAFLSPSTRKCMWGMKII